MKKSCSNANSENQQKKCWGQELNRQAAIKIILALKQRQPLTLKELCEAAEIDSSTFYRSGQLLLKYGVVKEIEGGYVLWSFSGEAPQRLWGIVLSDLAHVNCYLVEIAVHEEIPSVVATRKGRYNVSYKIGDNINYFVKHMIKGIVITKNNVELVKAIAIHNIQISDESDAILLTADRILFSNIVWKDVLYQRRELKEHFDDYDFSFNAIQLRKLHVEKI